MKERKILKRYLGQKQRDEDSLVGLSLKRLWLVPHCFWFWKLGREELHISHCWFGPLKRHIERRSRMRWKINTLTSLLKLDIDFLGPFDLDRWKLNQRRSIASPGSWLIMEGSSSGPRRNSNSGWFWTLKRSDLRVSLKDMVDGCSTDGFAVNQVLWQSGIVFLVHRYQQKQCKPSEPLRHVVKFQLGQFSKQICLIHTPIPVSFPCLKATQNPIFLRAVSARVN